MKENSGSVKFEVDNNGIGTIKFHHPLSNSLPSEILKKIADNIHLAGSHSDVKVIIIKSNGDRAFCGGASFNELVEIQNLEEGIAFFLGFANVINACRKCSKIIIGRVQGKAVGGGVGLASAVDYCYATKYSSIKLSELALGIGPFVVGPAVERKIGISAMSTLAINANKWFDASWAYDKGLFAEIFENNNDMDIAITQLTKNLSSSSLEAMKKLKKTFWEGTDHWDDLLAKRAEISGSLILSDFSKKIIRKIQNK